MSEGTGTRVLGSKSSWFAGVVVCCLLTFGIQGVSSANDSTGFNFGADGNGPAASGSDMPSPCSGIYGVYAGRVDHTAPTDGDMNVSYANVAQTNSNNGQGNGSMAYGDLEGPSEVSGFNGSTTQATDYGQTQATALGENYDSDIVNYGLDFPTYPLLLADVETNNYGWLTSANASTYPNWQTLNRDVLNGFISQIELMDLPNTSETLEPGIYTNLESVDDYLPNQTITNIALWESSWVFDDTTITTCSFNGFTINTSPTFTPQTLLGQSTTSNCFEFWQWASTDSHDKDWDQSSHTKLNSGNCPA